MRRAGTGDWAGLGRRPQPGGRLLARCVPNAINAVAASSGRRTASWTGSRSCWPSQCGRGHAAAMASGSSAAAPAGSLAD